MIGVGIRARWQQQRRDAAQTFVVDGRNGAPPCDGRVIPRKLAIQNGRLQVVQARVVAPDDHVSGGRAPMVAQQAQIVGRGVIVGKHRATVTEATERFGRVKAAGSRDPEGAGELAFEFGAQRLRRVFDDLQSVLICKLHDAVHIGRAPVQLHRHDGFGARADLARHTGRIEQMVGTAIGQHWHAAHMVDRRR